MDDIVHESWASAPPLGQEAEAESEGVAGGGMAIYFHHTSLLTPAVTFTLTLVSFTYEEEFAGLRE